MIMVNKEDKKLRWRSRRGGRFKDVIRNLSDAALEAVESLSGDYFPSGYEIQGILKTLRIDCNTDISGVDCDTLSDNDSLN